MEAQTRPKFVEVTEEIKTWLVIYDAKIITRDDSIVTRNIENSK